MLKLIRKTTLHDSVIEQVTWMSNDVICLLYLVNMFSMFKTETYY